MEKSKLRISMLSERRSMRRGEVERAGNEIQRKIIESGIFATSKRIASYIPIGNEDATSEIHRAAYAEKKLVAAPFSDPSQCSYYFVPLELETELESGPDGVLQPVEAGAVDISEIDLVIVPGVAFSRRGERLGRGGAVYDRLLDATGATKIGLCYGFQIRADIPREPHDQSVDWIATEDEFFKVENEMKSTETKTRKLKG